MYKGFLIMGLITSALGINGKDYVSLEPKLSIENFFNGNIKAWGIIQSFNGHILSRFDVNMHGKWHKNTGTLEEDFIYYDSGMKQHRTWTITKKDARHYTGIADDIVGTALGTSHGNAINWSYQMYVPFKNRKYKIKFDDWMWAMNDGLVINRSYLKKFGLTVAEITIFMQKQDG